MLNPIERPDRLLFDCVWALIAAAIVAWLVLGLVFALLFFLAFYVLLGSFLRMAFQRRDVLGLTSVTCAGDPRRYRADLSKLITGATAEFHHHVERAIIASEIFDALGNRGYVARLDASDPKLVIPALQVLLCKIPRPAQLFRVLADYRQTLTEFTKQFPHQPKAASSEVPSESAANAEIQRVLPAGRIQHACSLSIGAVIAMFIWFTVGRGHPPLWVLVPAIATAVLMIAYNVVEKVGYWSWVFALAIVWPIGLYLCARQWLSKAAVAHSPSWIEFAVAAVAMTATLVNGVVQELLTEWRGSRLLFPTIGALRRRQIVSLAVLALVAALAGLGIRYNPLAIALFLPVVWFYGLAVVRREWPMPEVF